MMYKALSRLFYSLLLTVGVTGGAMAELLLTAPPRESATEGAKIYGPLAEHLSELTGQKVVYQHPGDWRTYAERMKQNTYDIVFDGPHFAAWRIENLQASPVVRLPGSLQFVLVVKKDDTEVKKPRHLVSGRICALPMPNLATLTLYSMFPNPVRQPEYEFLPGGMKKVAGALLEGQCRGAILRQDFYQNNLSPEQRAQMRVLKTSTALTNQGLTLSAKISPAMRDKIRQSLTQATGSGAQATQALRARFLGKKEGHFVQAGRKDYHKHNLLRSNHIFGW